MVSSGVSSSISSRFGILSPFHQWGQCNPSYVTCGDDRTGLSVVYPVEVPTIGSLRVAQESQFVGAGFDSVFDLDGDFVHTVWVVSLFGEIYTDAVEEGLEVVLFLVEQPPFVSEDVLPESCHLEGFAEI